MIDSRTMRPPFASDDDLLLCSHSMLRFLMFLLLSSFSAVAGRASEEMMGAEKQAISSISCSHDYNIYILSFSLLFFPVQPFKQKCLLF